MSETGGILRSGLVDKAADLLHKLAGPMMEEFGEMLGDKARVYRVKNLVATMQKTEQILRDAGLAPNAVPPRLLLPIIENASVEDDETLQERWAGLLATASQRTDSVSPSFTETLKQLTPDEARHFQNVVRQAIESQAKRRLTPGTQVTPFAFTQKWGAPPGVSSDTFERLGLIRREYGVADGSLDDSVPTEIGHTFAFTGYAIRFLKACNGPRRQSNGG